MGIVWYGYGDFERLMMNTWTNMGEYGALLPALFQLFKQSLGGFVNLRHVDEFARVGFCLY